MYKFLSQRAEAPSPIILNGTVHTPVALSQYEVYDHEAGFLLGYLVLVQAEVEISK
jgi:hypothetical protein